MSKEKILNLAEEYYNEHFKIKETGDRVPVSDKIFDAQEIKNAIEAVLDGWWTAGRWTKEFEKKLSEFFEVKHVMPVNSGSSANLLAMAALASPHIEEDRRIKPGDEVLTVACGFPTTVNPIIQIGAIPVFVDVELGTYNADVDALEKAITPKTKAIILAHTLGNPFNLKRIKELCDEHKLWLIEDNCDAFGSTYDGKLTGTIGDVGTSSFYPAHHITAAEGGAVYTNNNMIAKIVHRMRDWGRDCWCSTGMRDGCGDRYGFKLGELPEGFDHRYIFTELGYNLKITDLQAAIGVAQLDKVQSFISKRQENFDFITEELKEVSDKLILPQATENSNPSWFGYPITLNDSSKKRVDLLRHLNKNGVDTRLLFSGNIVRQPYFIDNKFEHRIVGSLENSDRIMRDTFWFGVSPGLTKEHIKKITGLIKEFVE